MNKVGKALLIGLALLIAGYVVYLNIPKEVQFGDMVVFGDSISDQGNIFILTEGKYPLGPYYEGRFTNGYVWIDYFSKAMGFSDLKPSLAGGKNYAYGGAKTGVGVRNGKLNIGSQINQYLAFKNGRVQPDTLVVLWGGGNDFIGGIFLKSIANIEDHIRTLAKAGARYFFVPNFAPLGYAPGFTHEVPIWLEEGLSKEIDDQINRYLESRLGATLAGLVKGWVPAAKDYIPQIKENLPNLAGSIINKYVQWLEEEPVDGEELRDLLFNSANDVSSMYNHHLDLTLDALEWKLGIKIYRMDVQKVITYLSKHPEQFNIKEPHKPALDPLNHKLSEGVNPDDHMFFDGIHPTAKTHKILADEALAVFKKSATSRIRES